MRKVWIAFLLLVLSVGGAVADDSDFVVSNGIITGYNGNDEEVVIPAVIGEETITGIGRRAFSKCESLISVTLPEGIISIESDAFEYCTNLESINIPESVTYVGSYAFFGTSVESIVIPDGLSGISSRAFEGINKLIANLGSIGAKRLSLYGYDFCIPGNDNVKLKYSDDNLYAYAANTGITEADIPDGVTEIARSAFIDCENLVSVTLPDGVTSIGDYAFERCKNLESINLPESLTYIGGFAFGSCPSLASIKIPDGLNDISASNILEGNNVALMIANPGSTGAQTVSDKGYYFYAPGNDNVKLKYNSSGSTLYAHAANTDITEADIPDEVTEIEQKAFENCMELTSIVLPDGITRIGNQAFYGCANLKSINIPENVTYVGIYAFSETSVESIIIPDGLPDIASGAFNGINKLIANLGSTGAQTVSRNGYYFYIPGNNNLKFKYNGSTLSVSAANTYLSKADIPDGVTEIALGAFSNCENLVSISLPEGVTSIGGSAFSNCTSLTSINLPESLTYIGSYAFRFCKSLASITIPDGLNDVGASDLFYGNNVTVMIANLGSTGARAVSSRGYYFYIPGNLNVKLKEDDAGVYAYPANIEITEATIPNGVTRIDDDSFYRCGDLATVYLPYSVSYISSNAFPKFNEEIIAGCTSYAGSWAESNGYPESGKSYRYTAIHAWHDPEYTLAADGSSLRALRICDNDSSHQETETVETTGVVSLEPTCLAAGETTYTARSFTNPAFEVQSFTLADIPALGHDWGETVYTWADDNGTVTAVRICKHDENHAETEEAGTTSEVIGAATCEAKGERRFTSGEFENAAFTVQTKSVDIPALGHVWGEAVYTWADNYATVTAIRTCTRDSDHVETESTGTTASVTAATCETDGTRMYTSKAYTNTAFAVQTKTVTDKALGHIWGEAVYDWSMDSVTASHLCTRDSSHTETETVAITVSVVESPTQTAAGSYRIISDGFSNPSFAFQSSYAIPALNEMNVLVIPGMLTAIEDEAFEGIVTQAVIAPDRCASIGSKAFGGNENLQYVRVPKSAAIADDAFDGCGFVVIDQVN